VGVGELPRLQIRYRKRIIGQIVQRIEEDFQRGCAIMSVERNDEARDTEGRRVVWSGGAAHAPLALCYHSRFSRAGLNEADRNSAIHHAHAAIVVEETRPGLFTTTTLGDALRDGAPGAARATILTIAGSWQWKAWDQFLHALRTGQSGVEAAFGKDLFEFLSGEPVHSARFNDAMVGMHGAPAVVAAYDFSRFRSILDVGGGKGALLAEILKAHPQMNAVLFDLPETEQHARDYIAAAGLGGRCTFHAGDFFKHLPSGHDAYVMAHVLHDWSDDDAVAILRKCREAVPVEGRLLIVEAVLPDGNMPHHGKLMDLLMLTVTGGVERSQDEFAQILAQSGFTLGYVHRRRPIKASSRLSRFKKPIFAVVCL
jgi:hypothetical protein